MATTRQRCQQDGRSSEGARERGRERRSIEDGRARQREEFGGFNFGAAFFGWLVATGLAVLLIAILGAAGTAIGLTELSESEANDSAETIGIVGGVLLIVVLALAYYAGGYVAGRLSRFDGARQGLGAWLFGLVVTILLAVAGAVLGSEYNVLATRPAPHPDRRGLAVHRGPDRARRDPAGHPGCGDPRRQGGRALPPKGGSGGSLMADMTEAYDWSGRTLLDSHGETIVTRVVPTERVRLVRETISGQQTVCDEVRKEEISLGDG